MPQGVSVLRLFFGVLTIVAIGWQLIIHLGGGFPAVNFFSYFTNLANLFAATVFVFGGWRLLAGRSDSRAVDLTRGAAAVYMTVVGVVFSVLLRDVDLGSLLPWINVVVHYVMPVVVVAEFLFVRPRARLGIRQLLWCLLLPIAYLFYTLIRGAMTGWYPYPFLNPAIAGGYGGVALYIVGIVALFFAAGWLLFRVASRLEAANFLEVS